MSGADVTVPDRITVALTQRDWRSVAEQALERALADPEQAQALGKEAEQGAVADGDWAAASVARRARGVASMQRRDLEVAVRRLRDAIAAARRAGDRRLEGEAHRSLASALVLGGSSGRAFSTMERALRLLTGLDRARARSQRAALLLEVGRDDEALEDLRHALPVLRRHDDARWEVSALSNRSLALTRRRQFTAAQADLARARSLAVRDGLTLVAAYVEHNLGVLDAERGDVPAALELYDSAADRFRELGIEVGSLLSDRATLLLSVRLVTEARQAAEASVQAFTSQGHAAELPEAQLVLSTAALLDGDLDTAESSATAAMRGYTRLGNRSGRALARWAGLQAQVAQVGLESTPAEPDLPANRLLLARRARACATELQSAGWTVPALEARAVAGRLALLEGRLDAARTDLTLAARGRQSGPAEARVRGWLAEAMLRELDGRRRGAASALRTGLRVVEDYRATLGATELRAHVSVHRGSLARIGLRRALQDRDARAVHTWAERGRAGAWRIRAMTPPDDPALAHQLHDLRTTMSEIDQARGAGETTARLVARQVELERRIRDHTRRTPGEREGVAEAGAALTSLADDLGETCFVDFVELDDHLHAVTFAGGRARLHQLGPSAPVRHCLTHLPFALHRLAHPATTATQLAAAGTVLRHSARTLDTILLEPLRSQLGDRPLVIVPAGWLQSLPWSILPSCAGRPVSVAPSAAVWLGARRQPDPPGGVTVVAGPGLPGALEEAQAVRALMPGATLLHGPAATAGAVAAGLDGAALAHVAAHGTVRADNPLFSSLLLADGPFTVYDLEQLAATPHHVVLAACDTARSHVTAGEEILGLAAALLAQQTAILVAAVVPIPDAETTPLMVSYHRNLLAGRTPAEALAAAQEKHAAEGSRSLASAASFLCLGAGDRAIR